MTPTVEHNVSKAQKEVWEWKEKAYLAIADLPENEQMAFVRNKVKATVDRLKALQREKAESKVLE
jgi:hypothetical protein